jgi:predicted restriction endonuclease
MAERFSVLTPDQWNAIVSASEQSAADADIEQIRKRIDLSPTGREALVQARRGQGRFRQDLLKYWRGCAVVGSTIQSILRASHIKPWRESADGERLDPANGLLLTANLDALFNDGLISFNDHGGMLISLRLRRSDRSLLQLGGKLRKGPVARQIGYLTYHRERVFGR